MRVPENRERDHFFWATLDVALMNAHERTHAEVPDDVEQAMFTVLGHARKNHEIPMFAELDGVVERVT